MSVKSCLLVFGYIHELEDLLKNNTMNVIPFGIIEICHQFYFIPIHRFIFYQEDNFLIDVLNSGFISIDIVNKQICKENIIRIDNNKDVISKTFCHIPNISALPASHKLFNRKYFDAILGIKWEFQFDEENMCFFTENSFSLFLYENTTENQSDFTVFESNATFNDELITLTYCDEKHGVITTVEGENNHKLYQLELNSFISNNCIHKELDASNKWNIGKTHYLSKNENLFAMQKQASTPISTLKCSIFDLNKNTWIPLSELNISKDSNINMYGAICSDYDQNEVYLVYDHQAIKKYNFYKNKWLSVYESDLIDVIEDNRLHLIDEAPNVWFDNYNNNILYCIIGDGQLEARYFDIRENNKKWNPIKCVHPYIALPFKCAF